MLVIFVLLNVGLEFINFYAWNHSYFFWALELFLTVKFFFVKFGKMQWLTVPAQGPLLKFLHIIAQSLWVSSKNSLCSEILVSDPGFFVKEPGIYV